MADKGDAYISFAEVAAGAKLTIRPSASNELIIHNINCEAEITVQRANGVLTLQMFNHTPGANLLPYYDFHITNTNYIEIVNEDVAAKNICADGIVSK